MNELGFVRMMIHTLTRRIEALKKHPTFYPAVAI